MNKYIELFRVVPKGDGYNYMCKNKNGQHYLEHKRNNNKDALIFETESLAKEYIDTYLSMSDTMTLYVPEFILYHKDYVPNNIVTEVN